MRGLRFLVWVGCFCTPFSGPVRAQQDISRVEIGLTVPVLRLGSPLDDAAVGIGGQFAFNATKHFGVDAEFDGFPGTSLRPDVAVKSELLAGLRAGFAIPEGGLFVKIRPGLIQFPKNGPLQQRGLAKPDHFALDLGFIAVRHLSRHTYVRFDLGDTLINFGGEQIMNRSGGTSRAGLTHNPQLSLSFGLHF